MRVINRTRPRVSQRARRVLAATGLAAAAVVATALPASAGVSVSTTGGYLYCNTYNDGNGHGHADCQLKDTSADDHSVYAVMQVDAWPTHRYSNPFGYGRTGTFTDRFYSDVVHWDYHYKVCRNIQAGPDNCSRWIHVRS